MATKGFKVVSRILLLISTLLFTATLSAADKSNSNSEILTGTWQGELEIVYQPDYWEKSETNSVSFIIQGCEGNVAIRFSKDGKKYSKMSGPFETKSSNGTFLIYTLNSKKKWVQTNVWSIVKTTEKHAYFQWLRDVSNFKVKNEEKRRYFGLLGKGTLSKISDRCDVFGKKQP